MRGSHAPLLLVAALIAIAVGVPAAAAQNPPPMPGTGGWNGRMPDSGRAAWPRGVPRGPARPVMPSVRAPVRPAPPKRVTVGPTVKVPKVSVRRTPGPRVSIAVPGGNRRADPAVTVPHVTIYPGGVCAEKARSEVQIGECPRGRRRVAVPLVGPVQPPTVTPTPKKTPVAHDRLVLPAQQKRRPNPLGTVLLTVVVVTAISSTTAVAFRAR
ncbi:hypothetical protein [Nonomuraea maritima]|uniref:hypothetical protein n=1 Tax=Nonomuraea maritima TaxID=683260 RepID=UPI00115FF335|nr:hypothetical protein [Nonomuraea maritima]